MNIEPKSVRSTEDHCAVQEGTRKTHVYPQSNAKVSGSPGAHSVYSLNTSGSMLKNLSNLLLHLTLSSHWPLVCLGEYVVQVLQPASHLFCARGQSNRQMISFNGQTQTPSNAGRADCY